MAKTMTCDQLGGACKETFTAETFDDIAKLSHAHGSAMFEQQDAAHLEAMSAMQGLMAKPEDMQAWFDARRAEFDALPHD